MEDKTATKKNAGKLWFLLIDFLVAGLGVLFDQITKMLIRKYEANLPIPIIDNVLEISYLENKGAAFGMLQGKQLLFSIIFVVVIIGIILFLLKIPAEKKYRKLHIVLSFILAGAIGNTIDRFVKKSVTDFIYFKLINFPLFNVADIFITCCTILLVIFILFVYKDADFAFLKREKKEEKEEKQD